MRVCQAYGPQQFGVSFELYPPKTADGVATLLEQVAELVALRPDYITCTYGAGGSTRQRTLEIVQRVRAEFRVPVASHLTCVGSSVDQLRAYLAEAERLGVDNLVALRGDPPRGETTFRPADDGLRYANQLVELIRKEFPSFGIAVAGYPETHQEAPSAAVDLRNLKRKVDAGADVVITQLFYDNADYFRFRDACAAAGIQVPIVPGLLPVTNLAQIQRITALCGARLPSQFVADLEAQSDAGSQFEVGVAQAIQQAAELVAAGVPGIHFYVLNRSAAAGRVLEAVDPRKPAS